MIYALFIHVWIFYWANIYCITFISGIVLGTKYTSVNAINTIPTLMELPVYKLQDTLWILMTMHSVSYHVFFKVNTKSYGYLTNDSTGIDKAPF